MSDYLLQIKLFVALVLTFMSDALGGWDSTLSLLVSLVICDILTGTMYAIVTKKLSSHQMCIGIVRKLMLFMVVFVAFRIDIVLNEVTGGIVLLGVELQIRTLFIIYSCLEEGISLIENLSNLGVPFPKGIKDVLEQVTDAANSSLPKAIINFVKDKFHIDFNGGK